MLITTSCICISLRTSSSSLFRDKCVKITNTCNNDYIKLWIKTKKRALSKNLSEYKNLWKRILIFGNYKVAFSILSSAM